MAAYVPLSGVNESSKRESRVLRLCKSTLFRGLVRGEARPEAVFTATTAFPPHNTSLKNTNVDLMVLFYKLSTFYFYSPDTMMVTTQ